MQASTIPDSHVRAFYRNALATLGLTAIHHIYGGIRYATPWRIHGAFVAILIGGALVGLLAVWRAHGDEPLGHWAHWALAALVLVFPVLTIGLFEGLYNHVLKNVLFIVGISREVLVTLFPPPTYELPNDFLFELSGCLQVVPAAHAAVALVHHVWSLRHGQTGSGLLDRGAAR